MASKTDAPASSGILDILNTVPGRLFLTHENGAALCRKGDFTEADALAWPALPLFSSTTKACRLYGETFTAETVKLLAGPLELLLESHLLPSEQLDFRQLLLTGPDGSTPSSGLVSRLLPGRLCTLQVAEGLLTDSLSAIHELLPSLIHTPVSEACAILALPEDRQEAEDHLEALVSLLTDECPTDPLIVCGVVLAVPEALKPHSGVLTQLCDGLYRKGSRGVFHQESLLFESLCLAGAFNGASSFAEDLTRLAEPVFGDPELFATARRFIENNLSIGDAAQALYIHRNTMVYRLAKIEKLSGLDLRNFRHAMAYAILESLVEKPV